MRAQGWYRDPYRIHDDRWFSDGRPTDLVGDEGIESLDEPPPGAPPGPLVPAVAGQVTIGSPARPRGVPRAVRIVGVVALVAALAIIAAMYLLALAYNQAWGN